MKYRSFRYFFITLAVCAAAGCNSTSVRSTQYTSTVTTDQPIPESELLDVGIDIFHPGVDAQDPEEEGVFPEIRAAEARFMPYKLMETLQTTGNWGVVRVIPDEQSEMDVWVDAEILHSDGETLELAVQVKDSTGKVWFTRKYEETASKYAYDIRNSTRSDAFQGIYNKISNDMLAFRREMTTTEVKAIRTVTELNFAQRFSPEAFSDHLVLDEEGNYSIVRLPAENDPLLQRIRRIRERDYMFVDTLQEYYNSFVQEMEEPYQAWRSETYFETMALRQTRRASNAKLIGGVAAVVAGILGAASGSDLGRAAGYVGVGAGAYLVKEGLGEREEAKMHAEALRELGISLNAEVQPHTINLEDRSITLSGTVDDQYGQWRAILREIYQTETGQSLPVTN